MAAEIHPDACFIRDSLTFCKLSRFSLSLTPEGYKEHSGSSPLVPRRRFTEHFSQRPPESRRRQVLENYEARGSFSSYFNAQESFIVLVQQRLSQWIGLLRNVSLFLCASCNSPKMPNTKQYVQPNIQCVSLLSFKDSCSHLSF